MLIGTLWLYEPFYGQSQPADLLQCFYLIVGNDWCRYQSDASNTDDLKSIILFNRVIIDLD